ncbi:MAG: hypothetical protein E7409_05455 [Ruminococcaceae bacterium]|nr:hypothetical protein [Oscillospiraceae bacterium]
MMMKFKHALSALALAGVMAVSLGAQASGNWEQVDVLRNDIAVEVEGNFISADNFLYNDTTYLPIRVVGEMLGMEVTYDEAENKAILITPEAEKEVPATNRSSRTVGSWEKVDVLRNDIAVEVNGATVSADNFLYNDTTYLPIRAVGEMLGMDVEYNEKTNTAILYTNYQTKFEGEAVGTVNGMEVPSGMVEAYMNAMRVQNAELDPTEEELLTNARKAITSALLLSNEAKNRGFRVDKQFEQAYNNLVYFAASLNGGMDAFYQKMEESGYSPEFYKHGREMMEAEAFLQQAVAREITTADLQEAYEADKEFYKFDGARVKHILIKTVDDTNAPLPDAEQKAAKTLADKVYKLATAKDADFDALIAEYNEDPGMINNPEGYYVASENSGYVAEFEEASLALKAGQVSKPVKTTYGYHIIRCEDRPEYLPIDSSYVDSHLRSTLSARKLNALLMLLEQTAVVEWN